jgi:hypothetical protein
MNMKYDSDIENFNLKIRNLLFAHLTIQKNR